MGAKPRYRYKVCRDCGKPPTDRMPLSTRGLHQPCAERRMMRSASQLQTKSGPHYEEWRRSMLEQARRLASG